MNSSSFWLETAGRSRLLRCLPLLARRRPSRQEDAATPSRTVEVLETRRGRENPVRDQAKAARTEALFGVDRRRTPD